MGTTANAIPVRLERGEPADVLIMVGYALGDLVKQGKVVADSSVDLVKSPIGMAVKSGAPKPDISFGRCAEAHAAGGEIGRLFRQRQRRLYLDRDVPEARHRRRDERQGAGDPGHTGGRNRRPRRRRNRFPADQRTEAGRRHRYRRAIAGRSCRRSRCSPPASPADQRTGGRQGADQVSRLAGGALVIVNSGMEPIAAGASTVGAK